MINTNDIVSRIQALCDEHGISVNKMLAECGLSKSVVDNLKKGSIPAADKLNQIADYFDVSTDYLLKGENPPARTAGSLPPDQQKVIEYYERLNVEHQDYIKGEMVRLYMAEQAEREGAASSDEAM